MWGLAIALSVLCVMEAAWRVHGYVPSIVDDPALWSSWRAKLAGTDSRSVGLLGASRLQLAFSLPEAHDILPDYDIIQLAIDGRAPLAAVKDIAEETDFRGIVICSIDASGLDPESWNEQQEYVDYYHNRFTISDRINRVVATEIQKRVVVVNPLLNFKLLAGELVRMGTLPGGYLTTYPNRMRTADFTRLDIAAHRTFRLTTLATSYRRSTPTAPDDWFAGTTELEPYIQAIRNRGGDVVFIRMPTGPEHYEIHNEAYPRTQYWDRFAAATGARTIHYLDEPALRSFDTPDASHLDARDAPAFTRAFIAILTEQGLFTDR